MAVVAEESRVAVCMLHPTFIQPGSFELRENPASEPVVADQLLAAACSVFHYVSCSGEMD